MPEEPEAREGIVRYTGTGLLSKTDKHDYTCIMMVMRGLEIPVDVCVVDPEKRFHSSLTTYAFCDATTTGKVNV